MILLCGYANIKMGIPNLTPILKMWSYRCTNFYCSVVSTAVQVLNLYTWKSKSCLHFNSILHKVAIAIVSHTNLVYINYDTIGMLS